MPADNKHVERFSAKHVLPGEVVKCWAPAHRDKQGFAGVAILTDRRLVFYRQGMLGEKIEPYPLSKISAVEARKGVLFFDLKIFTSGDDLKLRMPDKQAGEELNLQLQASLHQPAGGRLSQGLSDPLAQIEQLAQLQKAGALSDGEFEDKKRELLARL